MTLPRFELLKPASLAEAVELLKTHGENARPIAGGTALVILMKERVIRFPYLVDLLAIPGLNAISENGGFIRIGAAATLRSVERSAVVRRRCGVLAEAVGQVGNVRVRETATIGGNLAHADYRLDPPAPLFVLGADVILYGPLGERALPIKDFFRGAYETALGPAEVLAEIRVRPLPENSRAVYLKYSSLSANDWPCLGVAALVRLEKGRCLELRLGLSGLAGTPVLVRGLDFVRDEPLTDQLLARVTDIVNEQISPVSDMRGSEWYKREAARVFVRRAIREAQRRFSP